MFDLVILNSTISLLLILITSRICGTLALKIKQPRVVGEMIAGVILGPSLLGLFFTSIHESIFTSEVNSILSFLSNLGLAFYMFTVGMELDHRLFVKDNLKRAGFLAISGIVAPMSITMLTGFLLYPHLSNKNVPVFLFALFLAGALSLTAFPMLARILQERELTNTRLGSLTMIAASVDDVGAWILLAFINALANSNSINDGLKTTIHVVVFIVVCLFVIRPTLSRFSNRLEKNISESTLAIVLILILATIWYTDLVGIYSVFGGFMLGVTMPRNPRFQKYITANLKDLTLVFLVPIFFANSGLKTNFNNLLNIEMFIPCLIILVISFIGKYGAATLAMRKMKFSWRESSAIGGLMNARGLMLLIFINLGIDYNLITNELFSILVIVAIITTATAMPIYRLSLSKFHEQNIKIGAHLEKC